MLFTNKSILQIAMEQSAVDANCNAEDFMQEKNVIVTSVANPDARKYLTLPFECNLISYGNNMIVKQCGRLAWTYFRSIADKT